MTEGTLRLPYVVPVTQIKVFHFVILEPIVQPAFGWNTYSRMASAVVYTPEQACEGDIKLLSQIAVLHDVIKM